MSIISVQKVQHWQNADVLYRQTVGVTKDNYLAYNNLGAALSKQGRQLTAMPYFEKALNIKPDYPDSLLNIDDKNIHEQYKN